MESSSKYGKVWMKKNSKIVQFFFLTLNFSSISKRKRAQRIQRFCSNYIKIVVCAISNYFVKKNNCFKVYEFADKIEHYRIFCKFSFKICINYGRLVLTFMAFSKIAKYAPQLNLRTCYIDFGFFICQTIQFYNSFVKEKYVLDNKRNY